MHNTAHKNFIRFLANHVSQLVEKNLSLLDVGSLNINGTIREDFSHTDKQIEYKGLDAEAGSNVDVVASSHKMPFKNGQFDVVASLNTFEHDIAFWKTFGEMVRVCRKGGYIFICAPSAGPLHPHPVDCWRFYIGAWKALEMSNAKKVQLVESYVDPSEEDIWHDSIGIYKKL